MDSVQSHAGSAPAGNPRDARDRLIVALDVPSGTAALATADQLKGLCRWFKVGMELYFAAGSEVIGQLRERGFEVFLDLKLHDIPNTVAGAVRSVSGTGASLLTVHAAGGERMMRAAAAAASGPQAPRLLGVTVLTSMDAAALKSTGVAEAPEVQVLRLARLARASGLPGLVCSAEEVAAVRLALGDDVLIVVPGVRPAGVQGSDDQARVATAGEAIARGASMLVVGRPITQAADPANAAASFLAEIESAQ